MSDKVEWKSVPGFPEYEVSDQGDVKNIAKGRGRVVGKILSPRPGDQGHLSVCLRHDNESKMMQLHRLVALTFHGPPPEGKPDAAHGDGNPANNTKGNVRWASKVENEADKILHGTTNRGEQHGLAKLKKEDIAIIRLESLSRLTHKEIAEQHGITREHARDIINGKRWKHLK